MDQNKILKSKNAAFSAIAKNPKLVKILNEAINAPVGSTKRVRAKSVLSILKKVSPDKVYLGKGGYGGQGGPLDKYQTTLPGSLSALSTTPSQNNISIDSAIDTFKNVGSSLNSWSTPTNTNTVIFPSTPNFRTTAEEKFVGGPTIEDTISKLTKSFDSASKSSSSIAPMSSLYSPYLSNLKA